MQPVRKQPTVLPTPSIKISDCIFAALTCSDANHFFDRKQKDLTIPDLSCFGSPFDSLDHRGDQPISNYDFNLGLGQEINRIFGSTIGLGVTFLSPEPFTSVTVIP